MLSSETNNNQTNSGLNNQVNYIIHDLNPLQKAELYLSPSTTQNAFVEISVFRPDCPFPFQNLVTNAQTLTLVRNGSDRLYLTYVNDSSVDLVIRDRNDSKRIQETFVCTLTCNKDSNKAIEFLNKKLNTKIKELEETKSELKNTQQLLEKTINELKHNVQFRNLALGTTVNGTVGNHTIINSGIEGNYSVYTDTRRGEFLTIEWQEVVTANYLICHLYDYDARTYTFKVEVSRDGVKFTTVFETQQARSLMLIDLLDELQRPMKFKKMRISGGMNNAVHGFQLIKFMLQKNFY